MVILQEEFGFDTVDARERCLRRAGLEAGELVLDVGTGSGWMAIVLARAGMRVISIDVDASALERARDRARAEGSAVFDRILFLRADAGNLPFGNATVAHVFSFDAMHHLPDCTMALRETRRVCRPGGKVVVADLNERGLAAVRAVVGRDGEQHYENACRLDLIGRLMGRCCGPAERHDFEFVTMFLVRKVEQAMESPAQILRTRKTYALMGASADREKYSFELLASLRNAGYTVYPVNPRYETIDEMACYPSLAALPERPEVAISALAPHNTERVVEKVAEQQIPVLWLPPNCGSATAVAEAERLGLTVIHDVCPIGQLLLMGRTR
jgi:hypothetical protein